MIISRLHLKTSNSWKKLSFRGDR